MARRGKYTFFFSKASVFSNWHPARFTYRGIEFCCVEQFMMYCKAMLFNDTATAAKILATQDPAEHKRLGRQVKGYDDARWKAKCRHYVHVGCREKFRQNPDKLKELLATDDTILVEASPYDDIWGVKLAESDPRIMDESQWQGTNWLGYILMDVREELRALPAGE